MKPYPKYKDSGIEWIGEIPEHWEKKRLKNILECKITDGPHETPDFVDEGIPFLSVDGIQDGKLVFDGCRYVSCDAHKTYSKKCRVQKGNILMGKAASIGKIAKVNVDFEFSIWSPLALIKPNNNVSDASYLEYVLKSSPSQYQVEILCTSNTQKNISMDDIPLIMFSTPTVQEQSAIASYLDRKTAQIDGLIEKKRKMIELLKEYRTALINHAVTKGLNPKAKMKDSGIEWLGEIPEHWEVSRLDFVSTIKARLGWKGLKAEEYVDEGYVFLSTPNIKNNEIDFINVNRITKERYDESPEIMLNEGDVLIAKDGSTLGTTNVIRSLPEPSTVNSSIAVIRPNKRIDSIFLYHLLTSDYVQNVIQQIKGGMGVPHLFQADLRKFIAMLPPPSEQKDIANYLDKKINKVDKGINEEAQGIELINEYRTALISNAVTGKIDVRDTVTA